jgi:hypothetical protein
VAWLLQLPTTLLLFLGKVYRFPSNYHLIVKKLLKFIKNLKKKIKKKKGGEKPVFIFG